MPPSGLHVLRVEETEVELRWDEPEPSHSAISGFAVTYAPLQEGNPKTDYLDRHQSAHVMRGLAPGQLYNISTFSVKRSNNKKDSSQPATALIRTSRHSYKIHSGHCEFGGWAVHSCVFLCRTPQGGGAASGQRDFISGLVELAGSHGNGGPGACVLTALRWERGPDCSAQHQHN